MEIPNLSTSTNTPVSSPQSLKKPLFSPVVLIIILSLSVASGFWLSRFFPLAGNSSVNQTSDSSSKGALSTDQISASSDLKIGQLYGNTAKEFKDIAKGTVKKGSINGEGTHILVRPGGDDQRVSLISSAVDLDLFVDRQVEVKGETNSSNKTGWLLDVGTIKILE
jgi:hypothetical protein